LGRAAGVVRLLALFLLLAGLDHVALLRLDDGLQVEQPVGQSPVSRQILNQDPAAVLHPAQDLAQGQDED